MIFVGLVDGTKGDPIAFWHVDCLHQSTNHSQSRTEHRKLLMARMLLQVSTVLGRGQNMLCRQSIHITKLSIHLKFPPTLPYQSHHTQECTTSYDCLSEQYLSSRQLYSHMFFNPPTTMLLTTN